MMTTDDQIRKIASASEICRLKSRQLVHGSCDAGDGRDLDRAADQLDQLLAELMREQSAEDAYRHSQWLELMDQEHGFTDSDLAACGLPVG